jgi:septum formation protein
MPIILASQSARRKALLAEILDAFECFTPKVEELESSEHGPKDLAVTNAALKAKAGSEVFPDAWVIGSDTVVALEGTLLGKPKDPQDARRMLRMLSGKEHQVHSGVSICCGSQAMETHFCESSSVKFFNLSEQDIDDYLSAFDPTQFAGAYPIQHVMGSIVAGFDGSYTNIVGLPMEALEAALISLGIRLKTRISGKE